MTDHPQFQAIRSRVEEWLETRLELDPGPASQLTAAMRYSLLGGGKRLRPLLVYAAAEAAASPPHEYAQEDSLIRVAAAIECVHSYSLIHDDLPCMDDDDLRRGQPTCHVRFGEATAVLAGDALLNLAYEILAEVVTSGHLEASRILLTISQACGYRGLVGGQQLDLEADTTVEGSLQQLELIHRNKTGALISAAVISGGLAVGAQPQTLSVLTETGEKLGLLFQMVDDVLDSTQSETELGKTPGKDKAQGKLTYVSFLGVDRTQELIKSELDQITDLLGRLPGENGFLLGLVKLIAQRTC